MADHDWQLILHCCAGGFGAVRARGSLASWRSGGHVYRCDVPQHPTTSVGVFHWSLGGGVLELGRHVWIALICGMARAAGPPRVGTPRPRLVRKPRCSRRQRSRLSPPCPQIASRCWQLCCGIPRHDSVLGGFDGSSRTDLLVTSRWRASSTLALDSVLTLSVLSHAVSDLRGFWVRTT